MARGDTQWEWAHGSGLYPEVAGSSPGPVRLLSPERVSVYPRHVLP
jgi:hypothetical protein